MTDWENEFESHRPLLFALAYRMLGVRADAEDVVQDAWIRWQATDQEEVRSTRSYLTTIVARLSLDALKSARKKRETYIGPWLPEPVVEPAGSRHVEMAESLSLAFLHLLESLSPAERVAFLLREVFDADYEEIAETLETSEANGRQLVARAKRHLHEERPRFAVDRRRQQKALEEFLAACSSGNASGLTALLAEDAVLYTDGGGKVPSALKPIVGAERIARFFIGVTPKIPPGVEVEFRDVNGAPGVLLKAGELAFAVMSLALDEEGRILRIYSVSNPDKLPATIQ